MVDQCRCMPTPAAAPVAGIRTRAKMATPRPRENPCTAPSWVARSLRPGVDSMPTAHSGQMAGSGVRPGRALRDQLAALGRPAVWAALVTTLLGYGGVFTSYVYIA